MLDVPNLPPSGTAFVELRSEIVHNPEICNRPVLWKILLEKWAGTLRIASIWAGVFLLITSGLGLPLVAYASSPVSAPPAQVVFRHSHFVDGVKPAFVVAPPYVVARHSFVSIGEAGLAGIHFKMVVFGPGSLPAQSTGAGCYQKLGLGAGESVVAPQSVSMFTSLTPAVPKVWWDFFQRRSRFEIYVEMLELMKRAPMTPFEVAFYARLNHKRTKEYVEYLESIGYLHPVSEDGRTVLVLTKDGGDFLERAKSLFVGARLITVANHNYQRDF